VRALVLLIVTGALATPAQAQSLQVTGHAGILGEWELSATVSERAASRPKQFAGVLTMKHVGVCTQDGPEEKTGEVRFELSGTPARMKATLLFDGVQCSYSGRLSDSYNGMMTCPDRRPMPLKLWVK